MAKLAKSLISILNWLPVVSAHKPLNRVSYKVRCDITGAGTFIPPEGEEVSICGNSREWALLLHPEKVS